MGVEKWLEIMSASVYGIDDMWVGWRRNPYSVWDIRGKNGENIAGMGLGTDKGSFKGRGHHNWGTINYNDINNEQFELSSNRADVVKTKILRDSSPFPQFSSEEKRFIFTSTELEKLPFVCEIPEI